ncbi:MAG: hypothetical protein D6701_02255, partial [Gemmatimonadetes bacterium]
PEPPTPRKPWPSGSHLVRCSYCGAVRERKGTCQECGR